MNNINSIVKIKVGLKDADFWIKRKGSESTVGEPTDEYSKEHFGVKVNREHLVPRFFYYTVLHLHSLGFFERYARGTLRLKHITLSDLQEAIYCGMIQLNRKRTSI